MKPQNRLKMGLTAAAMIFATETFAGIKEGGGANTFENVLETVHPLGPVFLQSKRALEQAGFKSDENDGVAKHNGDKVKFTRNYVSPKNGDSCMKLQVRVLAHFEGEIEELIIDEVKTYSLGSTVNPEECK